MTEYDWLACQEPQKMLVALRATGKASDRKLRLFAVACCRQVWHLLTEVETRQAVEAAERVAEGLAGRAELASARSGLRAAVRDRLRRAVFSSAIAEGNPADVAKARAEAWAGAWDTATYAVRAVPWDAAYYTAWGWDQDAARKALLLRDVFGPLPFRPMPVLPAGVLAWNDGCIVQLATAIYDGRDFSPVRMGVLADAMEEAGVSDAEVLAHVRSPGTHCPGCWCVDAILGRQ